MDLKTTFGTFRIRITESSPRKNVILSYLYSIGGKNNCLQISIPNEENPEVGDLLWIETERGECELDGISIRRELTHKMVLLLITFIKERHPTIHTLRLLDDSKLKCVLPNGKKATYSMMYHNLAFHQKTYYEKNFNARMISEEEEEKYKRILTSFEDPSKKPKDFVFNNSSLQTILLPIWDKTSTWKEFFKEIENVYGDKKCIYVYPWIKDAISSIFGDYTINQNWYINLENNNLIYQIEYTIQRGGNRRRTTRKRSKEIDELSFFELYDVDYRIVLD